MITKMKTKKVVKTKTVDYYLNLKAEEKRIKGELEKTKLVLMKEFKKNKTRKLFGKFSDGVQWITSDKRTINPLKFSKKVTAKTFIDCVSVKVKDAILVLGEDDVNAISETVPQDSIKVIKD
jgi:hypothetical protein